MILALLLFASLALASFLPSQKVLSRNPQHVFRTLPSGRSFLLNVPQAYNHDVAHPVVFSFHGGKYLG